MPVLDKTSIYMLICPCTTLYLSKACKYRIPTLNILIRAFRTQFFFLNEVFIIWLLVLNSYSSSANVKGFKVSNDCFSCVTLQSDWSQLKRWNMIEIWYCIDNIHLSANHFTVLRFINACFVLFSHRYFFLSKEK